MYVILLLSTPDGTIRAKMDLFTFMIAYPAIFAQMMDYLLDTGLDYPFTDTPFGDDFFDDALFGGSFGDDFFDDAWLDGGGGTALSDGPPAGFADAFATAFGDIMPQALIHLPGVAVQRREYIVPRGSVAAIVAEFTLV